MSPCWLVSGNREPLYTGNMSMVDYAYNQPPPRSGMGTYAGAARRRVHLATVPTQPLSGHRPGRRQARHAT